MKNLLRQFGFVIVSLLSKLGCFRLSPSIDFVISPETTRITEPKMPDGKRIDYFLATENFVYPPEMKTDKNGARLLAQTIEIPGSFFCGSKEQFYQKLGLDTESTSRRHYQDTTDFLEQYWKDHPESLQEWIDQGVLEPITETPQPAFEGQPAIEYTIEHQYAAQFDSRFVHPWTLDENPMMKSWLEENGPILDTVAAAARKKVFVFPLVDTGNESRVSMIGLPDIQFTNSLSRGLKYRANFYLGIGDIDRAIDDTISNIQFSEHYCSLWSNIHILIGLSLQARGLSISLDANPKYPATAAQLRRLIRFLGEYQPISSPSISEYERYYFFDCLQSELVQSEQKTQSSSPDGAAKQPDFGGFIDAPQMRKLVQNSSFDWNEVFREINTTFDRINAGNYDTAREYAETECPNPLLWLTRKSRSQLLGKIIASNNAHDSIQKAIQRNDCDARIQRIVLAMLLYEREYGTLPPAFTVDTNGKPLHSWRVLLLPYFEDESLRQLYDKIQLDQ